MKKYPLRKHMRKTTKIQGRWFLVLTFVLILCLGTIVSGAQKRKTGAIHYESVAIHAGDTLWSIARHYKAEKDDIERMIVEIMEINGMCSENIRSGERLIVPVKNAK